VITSFQLGEPKKSFQGGLLAEYYTGRHWSLSGRIKYFETGVSFKNPFLQNSSNLDSNQEETFNGAVISIPITIKWEFRIAENFRGYLKTGFIQNYETKSNYNFSEDISTDNPKRFGSFNTGIGLTYFINQKIALYIDAENYAFGGSKSESTVFFILKEYYYTKNTHLNFGIKYSLK
jgi:Outer membrane protein beta-barrel domain